MRVLSSMITALLLGASLSAAAGSPTLAVYMSGSDLRTADSRISRAAAGAAAGAASIEFVSGDTEVVGLQFDLRTKSARGQGFSGVPAGCQAGFGTSHSVTCNVLSTGDLRVIVFSPSNEPIPTATLVTFSNFNQPLRLVEGSVLMGDANAQAVKPEVL